MDRRGSVMRRRLHYPQRAQALANYRCVLANRPDIRVGVKKADMLLGAFRQADIFRIH